MKPLSDLLSSGELISWALDIDLCSEKLGSTETINGIQYSLVEEGILLLKPTQSVAAHICLSCGVHGNETAPIELVEELFKQILNGQLELNCQLLIVIGNQPAMKRNTRFCDENLNRLFKRPEATHVNLETERASKIMASVDDFFNEAESSIKIHLDLHTAIRGSNYEKFAIYPFQKSGNWQTEPMAWLSNAGIEAVLLANKTSGTFSCYTDHYHQAIGFTVELGKARAFGENDHSTLTAFKSALIELLNTPKLIVKNNYQLSGVVFNVVDEVMKHSESDFELNLADDFSNFSTLENGYQLTIDGDNSYFIEGDDKAIVFPNKNVPQGQRVALVVEPKAQN